MATGKKKIVKKKGKRGTRVAKRTPEEQSLDNEEVRTQVQRHCTLLASKAAARKKINADITASRNDLVARGLNRAALQVVEKCHKMEPQHADGFALTLALGMAAIGKPLQQDLFLTKPDEAEKEKAPTNVVPLGSPVRVQ